jgi:hypothetical protein
VVDPVHLALIHAEIDGELDEHRRADLSRLLLADPALRALRNQMHRLCGALDALPQAQAPARLRADIIAALPQNLPTRASVKWSAARWRYAAVLAGVILTGTIVFRLMDYGQGTATTEMAGTLAAPRAASTVDVVQLGEGPVSGQVSLVVEGGKWNLELRLSADAPVDLLVATGGQTVRVHNLALQGTQAAGTTSIALPVLVADGQPVNLTFLRGDREVSRAVLRGPSNSGAN